MPFISSKPAAITNLVASLRTALGQHAVRDGATPSSANVNELVTVGFEDPESTSAADGTSSTAGLKQPYREQYSIHCRIEVVIGAVDLPAARERAYELLGSVAGVLAVDKTLGGVVMSAAVGSDSLGQSQDSGGSRAVVLFDVDCDAFWRSTT